MEAGLGHIMPLNSIADEFEKLYGDKVEVVRSRFFTESGDPDLMRYEEGLKKRCLSTTVILFTAGFPPFPWIFGAPEYLPGVQCPFG